jgi:hypothetical protein
LLSNPCGLASSRGGYQLCFADAAYLKHLKCVTMELARLFGPSSGCSCPIRIPGSICITMEKCVPALHASVILYRMQFAFVCVYVVYVNSVGYFVRSLWVALWYLIDVRM